MTEPMPVSSLAKWLLVLAEWIVPKEDEAWLREMALELAFIKSKTAQFRWGLGALRFALGARLGAPGRSHSWPFALGALAVMALVLPFAVTYQGRARPDEVSLSSREQARNDPEATFSEVEGDRNADPLRQIDEPPAASASPQVSTEGAQSVESALADASADIADIEPEAPVADLSEAALTEAPLVVPGGRVELEVTETTRLSLYRVMPTENASPFFERLVAPGERYSFEVPFYLKADNAGGIRVLAAGQDLGLLGLSGETQTRGFE